MANIEAGSPRLYAHAVLAWAVSLLALRLLHSANKEAVRWGRQVWGAGWRDGRRRRASGKRGG